MQLKDEFDSFFQACAVIDQRFKNRKSTLKIFKKLFFYDPNFSDGHKIWTLAPRDLIFFWNDHHGLLCHVVWCLNRLPAHNYLKFWTPLGPQYLMGHEIEKRKFQLWQHFGHDYGMAMGSNTIQQDNWVHDGHFKIKIRSIGARVQILCPSEKFGS